MLTVEIIGNLGGDATVKEFNGRRYISFSVAHTNGYTDAQGQRHENTTWVSCLKSGESNVLSYLKKGTKVYVRGELSVRTYQAQQGGIAVAINCQVREIQLLSRPAEQPGSDEDSQEEKNNDDLPF